MKKDRKIAQASHVLGPRVYAAIAAVEGLRLTSESRKRLAVLRASNLSPAQRRAEVVRAYVATEPAGKPLKSK